MTSADAVSQFLDALDAEGIPHMIVGSLSSMVYAGPRNTKDADLVVDLGGKSIQPVADRVAPQVVLERQMTFESVTATTRYVFQVPEIKYKIEVFLLSEDAHDQERFRRRERVPLPQLNREACVPRPEDVIITKLRWARDAGRGKDADDVRQVIAVCDDELDWEYILRWSDEHGTREILDPIVTRVREAL
jgi:hypothetical protein